MNASSIAPDLNTILSQKTTCGLSVLIPMHNEESTISALLDRLHKVLATVGESWEVIFVNDGSADRTAELLHAARQNDNRIKIIHLSRNFGHQRAITAAIDHAGGDACVIMDGDLQDPPELIPQMMAKWKEGFEVVYAVREERQGETWFKKLTAFLFYRLLRSMTEVSIPADTGDFRLMDRKVVLALRTFRERGRFIRGLVKWAGFRQSAIHYTRESRVAGSTKFSVRKMMHFAIDALTSFSVVPLQLASVMGLAFSAGGFVYALYVLFAELVLHHTVPGWASLMIAILFFGGIQLMFLGVLGEYIGRIFEEVKNRPLYLIGESEGIEDSSRRG